MAKKRKKSRKACIRTGKRVVCGTVVRKRRKGGKRRHRR